uniref:LSM family member 14B n=1 Tax=Oryzias melastigma TaxID=30732 RepID=A0A3B3D6S4_ORYME
MPAYNQLAASSLLNHQYASAIGKSASPMVEKAVQTIQMENSRPVRGLASSQEQQWDRRQLQRRRRSHGRGQLMMNNVPSPVLQFDTDFDFDSSNAQFIKEELEREKMSTRGNQLKNAKEGMHVSAEDDHLGPKRYYDKSKSFFDNIPSDNGLRLTWAEERKRNLETFGVPGQFFRGQSIRGGFGGRREQTSPRRNPSSSSKPSFI